VRIVSPDGRCDRRERRLDRFALHQVHGVVDQSTPAFWNMATTLALSRGVTSIYPFTTF